jgi:hypothetical protein
VSVILQTSNTILMSIGMSIYFQWKLGLAMTTLVPVVLLSFYYQTRVIMGQDNVEKKALERSAKVKPSLHERFRRPVLPCVFKMSIVCRKSHDLSQFKLKLRWLLKTHPRLKSD